MNGIWVEHYPEGQMDITISLNAEQSEQLKKLARETNTSVGKLVRAMVLGLPNELVEPE